MKLKLQYALSPLTGLILLGWGGGMISATYLLGVDSSNMMNVFGIIISGLGFAITIKTLSMIKKLQVDIE